MRTLLELIAWLLLAASLALAGCSNPPRHEASPEQGPLLDREAVIQLARSMGLEEGLTEWSVKLGDHDLYGPVWRVQNTLSDHPGESGGRIFIISVRTGALVDSMGWASLELMDGPCPPPVITPMRSAGDSTPVR